MNRQTQKERRDDIRDLYVQGTLTGHELADLYGLDANTVYEMIKDLPKHYQVGQIRNPDAKHRQIKARNQTRRTRKEAIIAAYEAGEKQASIAKRFGIGQSRVSFIVREGCK